MKALIIGASGFVGGYLRKEMVEQGHEIFLAAVEKDFTCSDIAADRIFYVDILNRDEIRLMLDSVHPDWIIHLAAQSSVSYSWSDPVSTARINIIGALNVLEELKVASKPVRILLVGSSEEYGCAPSVTQGISEDVALEPSNPYAITKVTQEMFGKVYHSAFGMHVLMSRSFNHIGPGQKLGFVVPDFCEQIVKIERCEISPVLKVGNLSAIRDFTDVRDVVSAYRLILEKGRPGEAYNVGSGKGISIKNILEKLLSLSKSKIDVEVEPQRYRPIENPIIVASIEKLIGDTEWRPMIPIEKSLFDVLDKFRIDRNGK